MSGLASDLWPKRLELLKEIFPKLSRVAMLWNKGNAGMALEAKATQEVAGPLGVALQDRGVKDSNELEVVFAVMTKDRPDAFLALVDPVLISYRKRILDFLAKNRLPAIFQSSDWVEAGGLISYGPSYPDLYRRAAVQMDKILKGTKPADIPVEQPTKFELVINLRNYALDKAGAVHFFRRLVFLFSASSTFFASTLKMSDMACSGVRG